MKIIEFAVMTMSLMGSGLMSFGMFEGFYFYFVANLLGIYFFYKSNMPYMGIMSIAFCITSINGLVRNVL
jgi:hypothetical protein